MMIPGSKDSISVNIYKCSKIAEGAGKENRVRVTLHYGDEIQSIVKAIADTMFAFRGSSECPVQRNPYPIFLSGGAYHSTPVYNNSGNQKFFPQLLSELQFVADILPGNDPAVSS